ncbi:MAG: hypothetical protein K2W92_08580 [Alphaproteobacteria bacterium]|nr:hypothetical protein [Alphaproteobacteria bacterium]
MKLLHKPMLKLWFVFLFILNSSFVWSMIDNEEEMLCCTHSHTSASPPHIKALYIGETASLVTEDREETGRTWSRPIIRKKDDKYLRLLKEAFIVFPGNNTPNHLMVGIEALFSQSDTKVGKWHYWQVRNNEGILRDFCSAPSSDGWRSRIKLKEEETPQDIVVYSGTTLRRITFDSTSYHFDKSFPILSWMDHKFIQSTHYGYPHSEIDALNTLFHGTDFHFMFDPIIAKNNTLQGIVLKFYSYNDICDGCQNAIQYFVPKFQEEINRKFRIKGELIPVTVIGVANHCYGFSNYYNKESGSCGEPRPLYKTINSDARSGNSKPILNKSWLCLPQNDYNAPLFSLHSLENYIPFSGDIHAPRCEYDPVLCIYIKQPSIEGLEGYLKPEYRALFGIKEETTEQQPSQ